MDTENIKSWVSQPDVCRCCLSASGTWDLMATYITDEGVKEVYSDMLQECYGLTLSCLTHWGPSRLVCGVCVAHLREACGFRKQVLAAERHFVEHCRGLGNPAVKLEDCETQQDTSPDSHTLTDDENQADVLSNPKLHSPVRKRHQTHLRAKRKRKKHSNECDNDSDTPIAQLTSKIELLEQFNKTENAETLHNNKWQLKENVFNGDVDKAQMFNTEQHKPRPILKQVSERKRLILTSGTVLRDTTACPFRHHKSWFRCFFCSQDFMELDLLRNHTLQDHHDIEDELKKIKRYPRSLQIDISDLKCRHCDVVLTDVEAMRRHFGDVHDKVIYNECIADYKVNASPYTCHLCKREFHVFRTLTTHLNEHYANCICDVCGKSFLNSKRLKVHKRTHENGAFPCGECGKVLKTKTSKANHMESVHSKRVIKCQICSKPMKHYNDRIKHMSEVHNITHKFKCPVCSREYNIKHYLATHMRQTHGHKNKKCLECGMAFITNHGLKKHMLRHSGEKPYSCAVCSKAYVRSYTLREHMRVHEADRRV